jgi:hypothetical protein
VIRPRRSALRSDFCSHVIHASERLGERPTASRTLGEFMRVESVYNQAVS